MTLIFREMSSDDLECILTIEAAAHVHPWSRNHFESSLKSSHQCWVMEQGKGVDKNTVGYAITSTAADEAELLNITVAKEYQRQGFGKQLLEKLCESFDSSICSFFLEVRESNQVAIALYQSIGFNEVGTRPNYYPLKNNHREDAIIMALSL